MLLDTQTLKEIDDIIERAYTDFSYRIVGEDFLTDEQKIQLQGLGILNFNRPLVEILYLVARQRNTPGYREDKALGKLIEEITGSSSLPTLTDETQYTIEHSKALAQEAINTAKEQLKKEIKAQILTANTQLKEDFSLTPAINIPEREKNLENRSNNLLSSLALLATGATAVWMFKKEITDMMTNQVNSAEVDNIRELAIQQNKEPADVLVYKEVVNDDRLSPECRRLHLEDTGEPKLYRLGEVQANGTNRGKPRSAWKIVVEGTHPNCRCTLRLATEKMAKRWAEQQDKDED